MTAYYNEIDPYAAQWLRHLIAAGQIAPGDVDERSIQDVSPDDLRGYAQCHFFAGIGGWSYALRLAGWPDARPVWTGSCPCQPFSAAGKGAAADDERHLWPDWFRLIRAARPPVIFGEQVEAAIGWGWLDLVHTDLGSQGYATGFAVLPACGVGAPHIRQRLWFVAHSDWAGQREQRSGGLLDGERAALRNDADGRGIVCGVADALPAGRPEGRSSAGNGSPAGSGGIGILAKSEGEQFDRSGDEGRGRREFADGSGLVNAAGEQVGIPGCPRQPRSAHWPDAEFIPCTDGKSRPVEPGTFPLAHGVPGRVGRLRAYGNAIVPQVAAEFIKACEG